MVELVVFKDMNATMTILKIVMFIHKDDSGIVTAYQLFEWSSFGDSDGKVNKKQKIFYSTLTLYQDELQNCLSTSLCLPSFPILMTELVAYASMAKNGAAPSM